MYAKITWGPLKICLDLHYTEMTLVATERQVRVFGMKWRACRVIPTRPGRGGGEGDAEEG